MVRLEPPVGLPETVAGDDDAAWDALVQTQLADVRKSAENWRTGLAGILALVTGFTLIKGPTDVSSLESWASYVVGVLLLLALACAAFGAWQSLGAAYGSPGTLTRQDYRAAGGATGFDLKRATDAARKLRDAKLATIGALFLLCGAIGLTWYGPRPASVTVRVDRSSAPSICGKMGDSAAGHLDVTLPGGSSVRLEFADVVRLRSVASC
jgi:hypothetical protein